MFTVSLAFEIVETRKKKMKGVGQECLTLFRYRYRQVGEKETAGWSLGLHASFKSFKSLQLEKQSAVKMKWKPDL